MAAIDTRLDRWIKVYAASQKNADTQDEKVLSTYFLGVMDGLVLARSFLISGIQESLNTEEENCKQSK